MVNGNDVFGGYVNRIQKFWDVGFLLSVDDIVNALINGIVKIR